MVVGPCGVMHERAGIFEKNIFVPKMGKMDQKWARITVFLNLLEILDIVFCEICSIRKVCNICSILAQIPYFGKIWLLRYGLKRSRPI